MADKKLDIVIKSLAKEFDTPFEDWERDEEGRIVFPVSAVKKHVDKIIEENKDPQLVSAALSVKTKLEAE